MPIRILPSEVASQIAAGEVVERPASVVKELLENALDAGGTTISIQVEEAGRRLIEVSDNGAGIPANELAIATLRHATSKLVNASDLFHITTLGFRGEALASIGSVSFMTVTSKPPQEEAGARIRTEGGIAGEVQIIGAPVGTTVRVEHLFYNVPARLKFLKHDQTERRQIELLVTRYALAYPGVRFSLQIDGRQALRTSGNGVQREVLAALYGAEEARKMLEVTADDQNINVRGFISPPAMTRSHRREIVFFVNGRPVQDAALTTALLKAYHTLIMVGRYPTAVVFVELPPDEVDVNVHPAKAEVRFRSPERVFSDVQRAVRRALLAYSPVPELESLDRAWSPPLLRGTYDPAWNMTHELQQALPDSPVETGPESQPTSVPPSSQTGLPIGRLSILRLIGQVAAAYLVAEGPDGLYLIDQHAAHERVLFERMVAQKDGNIPSQALLQSVPVELPAIAAQSIESQLDLLSRLGFDIQPFGPNTYLVRSVPAILSGIEPAAALRVLVEDFEEDESPLQAELEARVIARVCKRAAIKAGKIMTREEQARLLEDLENCRSPRTCPHGRPTMIHLSVEMLERQFGRRGPR